MSDQLLASVMRKILRCKGEELDWLFISDSAVAIGIAELEITLAEANALREVSREPMTSKPATP